jgi:hypothetical protein
MYSYAETYIGEGPDVNPVCVSLGKPKLRRRSYAEIIGKDIIQGKYKVYPQINGNKKISVGVAIVFMGCNRKGAAQRYIHVGVQVMNILEAYVKISVLIIREIRSYACGHRLAKRRRQTGENKKKKE